jgi:hypothetical protein
MKANLLVFLGVVFLSSCDNGICGRCLVVTTPSATPAPTPADISLSSPLESNANVALNAQLVLSFNTGMQNVNPATVNLYEGDITGPNLALSLLSVINNSVFTFKAESLLKPYNLYVVVVSKEITPLNNTLRHFQGGSFSFKTNGTIEPELIEPADNSQNIPYDSISQLIIKFPYTVESNSLNLNNIILTANKATPVNVLHSCNLIDPYTIACTPGVLSFDVTYYFSGESIGLSAAYPGGFNSKFTTCMCIKKK